MKLQQPKYQILQKVWRIVGGKAKEETITGILTSKENVQYYTGLFERAYEVQNRGSLYDENEIFTTREELIASL